jgi:hypothetical protein
MIDMEKLEKDMKEKYGKILVRCHECNEPMKSLHLEPTKSGYDYNKVIRYQWRQAQPDSFIFCSMTCFKVFMSKQDIRIQNFYCQFIKEKENERFFGGISIEYEEFNGLRKKFKLKEEPILPLESVRFEEEE